MNVCFITKEKNNLLLGVFFDSRVQEDCNPPFNPKEPRGSAFVASEKPKFEVQNLCSLWFSPALSGAGDFGEEGEFRVMAAQIWWRIHFKTC